MVIAELADLLHREECSCVVWRESDVCICRRRGVIDLYTLLTVSPGRMRGALVADKVVGKGAAALMSAGGVAELYADVISIPALDLLRRAGIAVSYGECVPNIINRAGTGICPVEALCTDCTTADECLPLIEKFIAAQKNKPIL